MRGGNKLDGTSRKIEFNTPQHVLKKNESRNMAKVLMEGEEEESTLSINVNASKRVQGGKKKAEDLTTEPIPETNVQVNASVCVVVFSVFMPLITQSVVQYCIIPGSIYSSRGMI